MCVCFHVGMDVWGYASAPIVALDDMPPSS